jgi:hypothetical protein
MANPTCYYSWRFPDETQDEWGTAFRSGISQIDYTIRSISNLFGLIGRTTIVVSAQVPSNPAAYATQDGTSDFPTNQTAFVFHSLSMSPIGELQGTVTVTFSGARVRFDVYLSDTVRQEFSAAVYTDEEDGKRRAFTQVQYRLISNSLNISGDSSWRIMHRGFGGQKAIWWTALASLGVGAHTVTLQGRATSWHDIRLGAPVATSAHMLSPQCPVLITATLESN